MITAAIVTFAILLVAWLVAPAASSPSGDPVPMGPEGVLAEVA